MDGNFTTVTQGAGVFLLLLVFFFSLRAEYTDKLSFS